MPNAITWKDSYNFVISTVFVVLFFVSATTKYIRSLGTGIRYLKGKPVATKLVKIGVPFGSQDNWQVRVNYYVDSLKSFGKSEVPSLQSRTFCLVQTTLSRRHSLNAITMHGPSSTSSSFSIRWDLGQKCTHFIILKKTLSRGTTITMWQSLWHS